MQEITSMFVDISTQCTPYVIAWVICQYAVRLVINSVTRGKIEV